MTVETQVCEDSYVSDGTTAPRSIGFPLLDPGYLLVTVNDVPQQLGSDFNIIGDYGAGLGEIVPIDAWPSGAAVYYARTTDIIQPTMLPAGQPLRSRAIERQLDRATHVSQEIFGQAKRALKVPPGQAGLLVDLRDAEGKILQLFGGKIRGVPYYVPPGGSGTGAEYNVQDYGAKGIGTDHDDTPGFQKAIDAAWYAGGGTIVIPATPTGYNLAGPNIPYPGDPDSYVKRAVLKLRPNVSIRGVGMPRVRISGGRDNPPGMLFQAWWENDRIDNIEICGVWWDADCYSEAGPRNGNSYDGGAGAAEGDIYQFQHAIAIWAGSNIRIHGNKFSGYRGSGVFLGNVFNATLNEYLCDNAHVHNNEFVDMFRDAVFSASVTSGSAYHNWCHGDGYWVAVFDVERHSGNETLTGFKVYQNFIDGSDGERPIELGRPGTKLLRAGSIAFFYDGYPNDEVDGKFRGIEFSNNLIYRGVIDLWSATDSAINDNVIVNDTEEDIPNNNLITSAAISVRYFSGGEGVRKVEVKGNKILHRVRNTAPYKTSHGIWCVGYRDMEVSGNFVEGAELDGIRMDYCTGLVERNRIRDCGTVADRRAGIVASASQDQIIVRDNIIEDSRAGDARTIEHAVSLDGAFPRWPVITENIGANVHGALINGEALGFCHGNMDYNATWRTNRPAEIGGSLKIDGETWVGNATDDIGLVLRAAAAKRAQMIFSQDGLIEFIQAQLGDGTFIEQNFAEGAFQRNVRQVHPDGTYQLGLGWETPLRSDAGEYEWWHEGTKYYKVGSKPTGPTDGNVWVGGGVSGVDLSGEGGAAMVGVSGGGAVQGALDILAGTINIDALGADDDFDAALSAAIIMAAPIGAKVIASNKTYYSRTGVILSDISAHIDFGSARIERASDGNDNFSILSLSGSFSEVQTCTLSIASWFYGASNSEVTKIQLASSGAADAFVAGDVVKVFANDIIASTDGAGKERVGEMAMVGAVAGDSLYLFGQLRETFPSSAKVAKMNRSAKVVIRGGSFGDQYGSTSARRLSLVNLTALVEPEIIDLKCEDALTSGLLRMSCYAPRSRGFVASRLRTVPSSEGDGGTFAYGIFAVSETDGMDDAPFGRKLRHLWTSGAYASDIDDTRIERFGGCIGCTVNDAIAIDGEHAAYDTHPDALGVTFNNCRSSKSHRGPSGTYYAFQLRGRKCSIISGVCEGYGGFRAVGIGNDGDHYADIRHIRRGVYSTTAFSFEVSSTGAERMNVRLRLDMDVEGGRAALGVVTKADLTFLPGSSITWSYGGVTGNVVKLAEVTDSYISGYLSIDTRKSSAANTTNPRFFDVKDAASTIKLNLLTVRSRAGQNFGIADLNGYDATVICHQLLVDGGPLTSQGGGFYNAGTSSVAWVDAGRSYLTANAAWTAAGVNSLAWSGRGEKHMHSRVGATVAGVSISSIPKGAFDGQLVTIHNDVTGSEAITVSHNPAGYLQLGADYSLSWRGSLSIAWDSAVSLWRPVGAYP